MTQQCAMLNPGQTKLKDPVCKKLDQVGVFDFKIHEKRCQPNNYFLWLKSNKG